MQGASINGEIHLPMKTKHTEGKWIVKDGNIVKCNNTSICMVVRISVSDEAAKANARLIAAAPQMLETIQECLDTYENKNQNGEPLAIYEKCLILMLEDTHLKATGFKWEPRVPKSKI